jgi:glucosamine--fructose-6-phosphate aminotransferase (isomerizing)
VDLCAGDEQAVPATKTFTAQLAAFAVIAEALGDVPWTGADWHQLPSVVESVLTDPEPAERAADALRADDELICLARGYLMCVALEAALKLREAAGVRAEGWSAADFRHGPVTVARGDLPVLTVSAHGPAAKDVADLADSLESGGTRVLRIADTGGADLFFPRRLPEPLAAIPATVRAQQLALASALARGADPDRPPGLNKVTATE